MRAAGILVIVSALSLSACGGGGGSSSAGGQTGSAGTVSSPWSIYQLSPPQIVGLGGIKGVPPTSFPIASGSTPDFDANLPAAGTKFPLNVVTMSIDKNMAQAGPNNLNSGVQLTFLRMQDPSTPVFELTEPDYGIDLTDLAADGSTITTPDGGTVKLQVTKLDYSIYAYWALTPLHSQTPSVYQRGIGISGYQTPAGAIPASGSATFLGNNTAGSQGGAQGSVYTASGQDLLGGSVNGQASMTVDFGAQTMTGTLSNMMVTGTDNTITPWNTITLNGTLSGTSVKGTTATPAAASGTYGLSASSTGFFGGALFGPNGQEIGVAWDITDPTVNHGKIAFGFAGATKQ